MMVLAIDHAAEPAEIALDPIRVIVAVRIGHGVIDPARVREDRVQLIPVDRLIGEHDASGSTCLRASATPSASSRTTNVRVRPSRSRNATTTRRVPVWYWARRRSI